MPLYDIPNLQYFKYNAQKVTHLDILSSISQCVSSTQIITTTVYAGTEKS